MKRFLLLFFLSTSYVIIAQHQDKVDFIRGKASITLLPETETIIGLVGYRFEVLNNIDSVFLDARNIQFLNVKIDKKNVEYKYDGNRIIIEKNFKKRHTYLLALSYSCKPKQTVYFQGFNDDVKGNEQIWTQGQGKYTSHWLPSFDAMEEKVEFDLNITANSDFRVVANGVEIENTTKKTMDSLIAPKKMETYTALFDMQKPMSSYLLAFAIGNYEKQELKSASGISIQNYYYPKDSLKVEPTYRYTKEIFDFLEKEIGVAYPWQNYKQVPVHDFLYAGMENTTLTIFSDQYMIDSTAFVDKNYVNVNAHEMAHQWFGNLVTEKSGDHHWLHEGFATYYAYLTERHLFGDDHFYWKLYKTLNQLKDQADRGEGQSLLNPKASSLTFYEKGAWALFMLRNEVGDEAFKKGIKDYLEKYQFKNVTVDNFLKEMEVASGKNLFNFRKVWLESENLPYEKAREELFKHSSSLRLVSEMETDLVAAQSDDINYAKYWDSTSSIHFKKHLLDQNQTSLPEEIFVRAFESDTVPIRQALLPGGDISRFVTKENLESLLKDHSYVTKEGILFTLWRKYPEDRVKYLNATKSVIGLPNKNVRIMWLTLAMLTERYESFKTKEYFDELSSYTNPEYSFEIRQGAFFYLKEAFGLNEQSLKNLIKATEHHSWQFKKFARDLLNELLEDADYKPRLEKLSKELNSVEIRYLNSKLKE